MSELTVLVITVVMLVLLFLKVPVYVAILGSSLAYFIVNPDVNIVVAAQRFTSGLESMSLLACPFLIMAGVFFNHTGVTERLLDFCKLVTGRMTGGLAQANILLSTLMGGMSGSSTADCAMEAKMLVPGMIKSGLSNAFSSVITAVSSIITPLIPPGIGMILYATLAGASIGQIFVWGFAIGVIMCITMAIMTEIIAKKRGYKPYLEKAPTAAELAPVVKRCWPALVLPFIIIGSIRFGIVSATEAGAVACAYAVVLGIIWRELNFKKFMAALREGATSIGSTMLLMGSATIFSWIITKEQIPQALANVMLQYIDNKYMFLFVVNIFLLLVGAVMSGTAAVIILVPILAPIAQAYGINLVHFGMIITYNMAIGGITPPYGITMYVTIGVTGCKMKDFIKECIPWFIYMFVFLVILTYLPIPFL